MQATYEIC